MRASPRFYKLASVCAFITALTTLAIHLLPELWANVSTFEEQIQLPENSFYMARLWVVIAHCLLVVVSMYAVGLRVIGAAPVLVRFGFLSFVVFAYTEILRTSLIIFALNRTWRAGYATAADEAARVALRATIGAFSGINDALFFVFSIAFFIGILCYGFVLIRAQGLERKVGVLFLLWAAISVPGHLETVTGIEAVSIYFGWVGPYFQPIARTLIGVWLWKVSELPAARCRPAS